MYFKVFKGNEDSDSIVYHQLNPPIKAHYIKLRPTAWYGHISLRMELCGCSAGMIVVLHELIWHWKLEGQNTCFDYQYLMFKIWIRQETLGCQMLE